MTCRDLPPLATQGEDEGDALVQAADAMDETFAAYMIGGLDFPEPSKPRRREHLVSPPAEKVAKAGLYVAMREAGVSKTELARQMGIDEKEVRRMLDPLRLEVAAHRRGDQPARKAARYRARGGMNVRARGARL